MLKALKRRVLKRVFADYYEWRLNELTGRHVIQLDYPVRPAPRYEPGRGAHRELWQWFDRQRAACIESLRAVSACLKELESIPANATNATTPHWDNDFFSALDAMALYSLLVARRPALLIEVGSGNSTKFAYHAVQEHRLPTTLVSVDPEPREEIDDLCANVIRQPLESTDQRIFTELGPGDFLFIDSSHRVFTNSDVTTFFLELLPRLRRGVIVHVHDIFLPWDYPAEWNARYYSEQYLMACWLLAGPARCKLLLSNAFISFDGDLRDSLTQMIDDSPLAVMFGPDARYGGVRSLAGVSLWFEVA